MKNFIATCMGLLLTAPVMANPLPKPETGKIAKGFYTMDAMGCMLLQECTEGIDEVFSIGDISHRYNDMYDYDVVQNEFNQMLMTLNQIGTKVYIAPEKYFPVGHRGVYHTVSNNFYLNEAFMHRPSTLMSVMRHEGWHAAQDCMAGTLDNNMIAIIMDEEKVPQIWQDIASKTYAATPSAIPWEKEAFWAGKTEGMTLAALQACASGRMWEIYEPTPMTREWLEKNGFITGD